MLNKYISYLPFEIQLYILSFITTNPKVKLITNNIDKTINKLRNIDNDRYNWYIINRKKIILLLCISYPYLYNNPNFYPSQDISINYRTLTIPLFKNYTTVIDLFGFLLKCLKVNGLGVILKITDDWDTYSNLLLKWFNVKVNKPQIRDKIYFKFKRDVIYKNIKLCNKKYLLQPIKIERITYNFTKDMFINHKEFIHNYLKNKVNSNIVKINTGFREYKIYDVYYLAHHYNKLLKSVNLPEVNIPKIGSTIYI